MDEEFYRNTENGEEKNTADNGSDNPTGSSVEYGPSPYEAKFKRESEGRMRSRQGKTFAIAIAVCVAFSLLCGVLIGKKMVTDSVPPAGGGSSSDSSQTPAVNNTVIMNETSASAATLKDGTVTAVVEKSSSSVVEIILTSYSYTTSKETVSGVGSGVIIGEDENKTGSYIVTNNHVIEGNYNEVIVCTSDGKKYSAQVVGTDWQSDIAVLRIEASGLKSATWADSNALLQGQDVVVIGNPLGSLGGSVTSGVLSGVERTITIGGVPMKLLQIDAAVNPGNSGGGLFDMNGNLIGIVNAKSVGTNIEGLGFAIPSNYAKQMVFELAAKGYVSGRVDLGLTFREESTDGLVISGYTGSDGDTTEILAGDILTQLTVNGSEIAMTSVSDYRGVLAQLKAGDTVKATIGRVQQQSIFHQRIYYYTVTLTAKEIVS